MKDRPTRNTQPKKAEHMATNPMGRSQLPLNTEIWVDRMLAFVRMEHFAFVSSVSHQMKECYQAHCERVQNPPIMAMNQQNASPPSRFPATKGCTFIASRGNLQVLKWARQEKKCPWNPDTFAMAAAGGYLEILRYAVEVEQDCPWNEATCKMAASIGNWYCLQSINSHSTIKLLKTAMASSNPTFTFPNPIVTRVHGTCNYASLLVANPSPPSPQATFDKYNLQNFVHNGIDHLEICKGMYGLPQAGLLANNQLGPHLALQGYIQSPHIHGLFIHKTRPIMCCLMVDDFVVKYNVKANRKLGGKEVHQTALTDYENNKKSILNTLFKKALLPSARKAFDREGSRLQKRKTRAKSQESKDGCQVEVKEHKANKESYIDDFCERTMEEHLQKTRSAGDVGLQSPPVSSRPWIVPPSPSFTPDRPIRSRPEETPVPSGWTYEEYKAMKCLEFEHSKLEFEHHKELEKMRHKTLALEIGVMKESARKEVGILVEKGRAGELDMTRKILFDDISLSVVSDKNPAMAPEVIADGFKFGDAPPNKGTPEGFLSSPLPAAAAAAFSQASGTAASATFEDDPSKWSSYFTGFMTKAVLFDSFAAHVKAHVDRMEMEKAKLILLGFLSFVFMFMGGTADAFDKW
jgi:hypothetical protein